MSAVRTVLAGRPALRITDSTGDTVEVTAWGPGSPQVILTTYASMPGLANVAVSLEDGLALLSFVADALGVERYVPDPASPFEVCAGCGGDLRTAPVVEVGVEWCHAPIRRPGGGS